jgi:phosphate/sulfate permease
MEILLLAAAAVIAFANGANDNVKRVATALAAPAALALGFG